MSEVTAEQPTRMFQSERHERILKQAVERGRVDVTELAAAFDVTTETIRRDLSQLQEQRLVRRVHGGAVSWERFRFEPLLAVRDDQQVAEKRRIAQLAVDELPPEGTILIDSGSTAARLVEVMPRQADITVVTNSLTAAEALADHDLEVIVLGGLLRKDTLAMVDAHTVTAVRDLAVSTLFFSCDGFSPQRGLMTPYRHEAALKSAMMRAASKVVAMADHTKLGNEHLVRFASWAEVDVLITNTEVPAEIVRIIEDLGTTVRLA